MELKQELLDVLIALGATEAELASLVDYYTSQLAAADGAVATIVSNIASLEKQLSEETARSERIKASIRKYVKDAEAHNGGR